MTVKVVETIALDNKECEALQDARTILDNVRLNCIESYQVDDQVLPTELIKLIQSALLLEMSRPYTIFNYLDNENMTKLQHLIWSMDANEETE